MMALLVWTGTELSAQQKLWVMFTDKGDTQALSPREKPMLSAASLARRNAMGIGFDASDLPVYSPYVDALRAKGFKVLSVSRWLNAAVVEMPAAQREALDAFCFVREVRPVRTLQQARARMSVQELPAVLLQPARRYNSTDAFDYGEATHQNTMLNIRPLHERGFSGRGVRVAVFDSGFDGADTLDVFDSLWAQKRIIGWRDFVDGDKDVFRDDSHGTQVLSTIAANLPGDMVGMAPHASFLLCRTENARSETQQEEHNWVRAMEWADSIGVDVIHTSLGYSEFDNEAESYTHEDLNGRTAIVSRAAALAARKGIIVTTSAGNEGDGSWGRITAPCDADSILCVGAVDRYGKYSRFSSYGPSADGRVKPDVVAMGSRTTVASPRNYLTSSDGTSFSGPLVGGMVACLRQAHPKRSNLEIIEAVRLSGDQFNFPDEKYGYGIPNAAFADSLLRNVQDLSSVVISDTEIPQRGLPSPAKVKKEIAYTDNPASSISQTGNQLTVSSDSYLEEVQIMRGRQKVALNPSLIKQSGNTYVFDISVLLPGEYHLYIRSEDYEENLKFVK